MSNLWIADIEILLNQIANKKKVQNANMFLALS
jgi:hypothetical protein